VEVDSDGDMEDVDEGPAISAHEAMTLCEEIDKVCLQFPNVDNVYTGIAAAANAWPFARILHLTNKLH